MSDQKQPYEHIILAFDFEWSGKVPIGLGCSVQNEHREELDSLFIKGYLPEKTKFEKLCKEEFWDKHPEILKLLICEDPKYDTPDKVEDHMLDSFTVFYIKWDQYAQFQNKQFHLVSDNKVFDGGIMNNLYSKWGGKMHVLPYRLTTCTYGTFWETHSMQKQVLRSIGIEQDWNLTEKVQEVFDFEPFPWSSDHNPLNDSRCIASEYSDLLSIGPEQLTKALEKCRKKTLT